MPSDALRDAYQRDGFIVVPDLLGPAELTELRQIITELVAGAAAVDTHTAVYDLEPGHTRAEPKVRRIKTPHKVHPAFDAVVRRPDVMEILTLLLGPAVRLHSSKLNMGLRVRADWLPEGQRKPTMEAIRAFLPTGEPDATYDSYKEHL